MTVDDERPGDELAPVTPLFGRDRGRGVASHPSRGVDESAHGPSAGLTDRDSANRSSDQAAALAAVSAHWSSTAAGPGADEVGSGAEGDVEPEDLEAQKRRAENISLHALSRRGVSSAEMTKLLRTRDLDESVVLDEVARLERVGLLDDAELAENLVRAKQERKGLGRGAVSAELRARGIDAEAIEAAMAEIDEDDEQARADEWARRRASSLRGLDRETAERRLNGYLMRRGYRSEVVRRAIEKALPRGGSSRGGVRFE